MGARSFPKVMRPGSLAFTTYPPYTAEVEERVELYIYSPSGPSWPVLGLTLLLPYPCTYLGSLMLVTCSALLFLGLITLISGQVYKL